MARPIAASAKKNIDAGTFGWDHHLTSRKHVARAKAQALAPNIEPEEPTGNDDERNCRICQQLIRGGAWNQHLLSSKHQRKEAFTKYKAALDEAEKDKNGVSIGGIFDFDFVDPAAGAMGLQSTLTIKTSLPFSKSVLVEAKLASSQGVRVSTCFAATIDGDNRKVISGRPITLKITFRQSHIGRYEDRLELLFEDTQLKKQFIISRTLKAIVGNKTDHEALKPKSPYIPRPRTTRQPEKQVVEGVAPAALDAIPYVGRLPRAEIPQPLLSILSGSETVSQQISHVRRVFIPNILNSDTYGRHFKHLLWIEEFKMEHDLARYDMHNVTLSKHNSFYYLQVPGLAEKRPSVLVGDQILVQKVGAPEGHWYQGRVHVVRQTEVGLRFHGSFGGSSDTQPYNVRFKLNRIPVKRQHQAMDTVFTQDRVLFPLAAHLPNSNTTGIQPIKVFNSLIQSNQPQLLAVKSIVNQTPGSPPFVVFGPPGTGKTITIVEAILQLLRTNSQARILACAPSNSAADLIAERLSAGLNTEQLFRLVAPSRSSNQVPDAVKPYTYTKLDGHFSVPIMPIMKAFKVIVSTCVSASIVSGIGMARGHFTHIFIDEAGQATEPEAFVSIKMMADNKTNVVLSGDPKQLGPIIRSGVARELGLEVSYLERLMGREVYSVEGGNVSGRTVVKLVKNFRSHQAILQFPNERFYNGDLQPCANPAVINAYLKSSYLPSKKFPIVFHAVSGKDDREASSPSFFNIDEVLQVKDYVQRLRADRRFITTDKDIGVIAPYHAQCLKLRTALRAVAHGVKVGSVEEFQGQERKVIIISTVRSSREFVEYDLRHTLGFVANPRRFNVAVTRAQALLIIVGDPQVLSLDPLWRSFLNYIHNNGGWTGPGITWDPTAPVDDAGGYDAAIREAAKLDMSEFARRMGEMMLGGDEELEADAGVDRPWRDVE